MIGKLKPYNRVQIFLNDMNMCNHRIEYKLFIFDKNNCNWRIEYRIFVYESNI